MQGKNASNSTKPPRRLASTAKYVSPNQLVLDGFETPFEQKLTQHNRWVKLSKLIPWDEVVGIYNRQFSSTEGRPPINGRIIIGAVIIKHILNLTDDETILQIQENMFMQYFLGYTSFSNEAPFDSSLFVDIRKRMSKLLESSINDAILKHHNILPAGKSEKTPQKEPDENSDKNGPDQGYDNNNLKEHTSVQNIANSGTLLMDATVCPQAITYPTDLKVVGAARRKSEELIDKLYLKAPFAFDKPRTYREVAHKEFLHACKKKILLQKERYRVVAQQLRYLRRNLNSIDILLALYENKNLNNPLNKKDKSYLQTIATVYAQQNTLNTTQTKSIEKRIVNIHQPHVRPMPRGKAGKRTEFGSKIQVSLIKGFAFIDKLSWENFNEGVCLKESVEEYKNKFGCYPARVLADRIYANRENRKYLKGLGIQLIGKPLGRPPLEQGALSNHIRPGERNPIEGKFGQAKLGYGLDRVRAKLRDTSEAWISSVIMVVNLVNLMRLAPSRFLMNLIETICQILKPENEMQLSLTGSPM